MRISDFTKLGAALSAAMHRLTPREFLADNGGHIAIMTALGAPVLGLAVAGGIALTDAEQRRSTMQDALDAAVLAGAAHGGDADDRAAAARSFFNANRNPIIRDAEAQFEAEGRFVTGMGSMTMPTVFAVLFGRETIEISADARAERSSMSVCLLGLNGLDNGAFDINGNPDLQAPDCAVHANSGSGRAMTQEGNAPAKAGLFSVRGGARTNGFSPTPRVGQEVVADPYAHLPFMQHEVCDERRSKGLVVRADVTLQPGTYCGGINITGSGVKVTMAPGEYVMVNGSLLVNGNATLEGREVVVGFTGSDATLRVWGNGSVDLTSPTSGTYANMQFFQDRDDARGRGAWVSIGGNGGPTLGNDQSKLSIDGAAYFPTQNFWVYGAAQVEINSPGLAVVADKIWFQGSAKIEVTSENRRGMRDTVQAVVPFGARLVY